MADQLHVDRSAGGEDVRLLAGRARALVDKVIKIAASPLNTKKLRTFSGSEVSGFTGISATTIKRKAASGVYPAGTVNPKNGHRTFTMLEMITIMEVEGVRESFARGVVVAVANFKGGVAKTTSAVHYAQYEALRGLRVLFVDLDPQASGTSSFGLNPDSDVSPEQTARDFLQGDAGKLVPQKTYWPNIDLIPANLSLYSAEFEMPKRTEREGPGYSPSMILTEGLEALRGQYDVIVIDTPPALSYLTTNAIFASDGVVVPVQANMMDFTSCSQFLGLLADTVQDFEFMNGSPKRWNFLKFLVTRFGGTDSENLIVEWMQAIFGDRTIRYPLSNTSAVQAAGPEMVSVYEADPRHEDVDRRMDRRTYKRALAILDPVMEEISTATRFAAKELAKDVDLTQEVS